MCIEKFLVFQFENGEVDPRSDGLDDGWKFVAGLIGLDLHFAGVLHDMCIGQNAFAADHDATSGDIVRLSFVHGLVGSG